MDLSVITVTWNNEEHIAEQVRSVFDGCKELSCEQFVVDNGSKDGTVDAVKALQQDFPNLHVIELGENKGFGFANNRGYEKSAGAHLLFLNPDMRVKQGSLDTIVEWMEHNEDVGIVCPRLIDQQGKVGADAMPRRLPTVLNQLALILKLPHLFPSVMDSYLMKEFDAEKEQDVDSVRGSFMLMRRGFVDKLGWAFDPRYFIWFEDVDICREAAKAGLRVVYTPVISCVDYVGQSFKKRTSLWKQKQFTKSMLVYFQKWEPWYKWMWIAIARPFGIAFVWLANKFHKA